MNLHEHILEYDKKDIYPFHMPGHKRNKAFFPNDFLNLDITEIPDMDNLHDASGILHQSQKRAAKKFGADESFFLVNGSTSGLISAILATVCETNSILVARNCHRSVYSGLVLSGATPKYIMPDITTLGIAGGVCPQKIGETLDSDDDISAVILTSPTYEGFVSDIESIAKIVHKKNRILIVDEAHGAHFAFSDFFPKSAVKLGADIVIQSLHKTLPALNQCAILHLNGERVNRSKLRLSLSMMQTSSPSYIFLSYMDRCLEMLENDNSIFKSYIEMLSDFRQSVENIDSLRLIGKDCIGKNNIFDIDLGKLVFLLNSGTIASADVERRLREEYRLQVELRATNHIIAMTSPADTQDGFDRLQKGITEISKKLKFENIDYKNILKSQLPKIILTPRQAFDRHLEQISVPISKSIGKTSASFVIAYPPGTPIVAPGEMINEDSIHDINLCLTNGIELIGQENIKDGFVNIIT